MKLIIAVVQDRDWAMLRDALVEHGYGVTRLSSTGGFLRHGNTTLLLGVQDSEVDNAIGIIRQTCRPRDELIAPFPTEHVMQTPVSVRVGGGTVIVLRVEKSESV